MAVTKEGDRIRFWTFSDVDGRYEIVMSDSVVISRSPVSHCGCCGRSLTSMTRNKRIIDVVARRPNAQDYVQKGLKG